MSDLARASYAIGMRGRRALVVGLAREGVALAGYLARQGARVVATDIKPPTAFGAELARLADAGVELALAGHPPSVLDGCEIAFISPGVPFDADFLNQARRRGIPLSTESRLFCQLCPAPIIGITGSSGKTTTATLVGDMLKASGCTTWVGGNIGQPLIESVDRIQPGDQVVMELSSFQLEYFHPSANAHVVDVHPAWAPLLSGWSPHVAAVLNITPNHLDRHPSMAAYIHAKRSLAAYRRPGEVAVLGLDDDITRAMADTLPGPVHWFSRLSTVDWGACLAGQGGQAAVVLRQAGREQRVCAVGDIQLRGEHNLSNVLAACAIGAAAGVPSQAMQQVSTTFGGVSHRLEWVAEAAGVQYYDDSIATSPERLVAALNSFDEPIVLLAGGRDKHLPWDEAARLMLERARHVILFGEAAGLIAQALATASRQPAAAGRVTGGEPRVHRCVTLEDAVCVAAQVAHPGEVVLLSPGCTSFDAFKDFAERGERFREAVRQLQLPGGCIPGPAYRTEM
jgi:UDP-N-acetylmuramoylalanine--D-glutamate ligase